MIATNTPGGGEGSTTSSSLRVVTETLATYDKPEGCAVCGCECEDRICPACMRRIAEANREEFHRYIHEIGAAIAAALRYYYLRLHKLCGRGYGWTTGDV